MSSESQLKDPTLFPDELIFHIFCFLNPTDVIHLRFVSKQFNNVAHDVRLWRILYQLSCLPRPSGSFPWQSLQFLERHLILSELVSRTWTSQPLTIVPRGEGPRIQSSSFSIPIPSWNLLFGRYYLWTQGTEILAQDHHTNTRQVLWKNTEQILAVNVSTQIFPDGQRVYAILNLPGNNGDDRCKLLEFSAVDDTGPSLGPVTLEFDCPSNHRYTSSSSIRANPPWLYILNLVTRVGNNEVAAESLVINTETRATYRFPEFSTSYVSDYFDNYDVKPRQILIVGNYIVTFRRCRSSDARYSNNLFQAFIPPDPLQPPGTGTLELRLTHEKMVHFPNTITGIACQLRDTIVRPETGDMHARLLGPFHFLDAKVDYKCVDITIPPPSSDPTDIFSMDIKIRRLFSCRGILRNQFFAASQDGYGRGGFMFSGEHGTRRNDDESGGDESSEDESGEDESDDAPPFNRLYKFSIDASGEECVAVVGKHTRLSGNELNRGFRLIVDSFTGSTFYELGGYEDRRLATVDIS